LTTDNLLSITILYRGNVLDKKLPYKGDFNDGKPEKL
jgi:hypothetical protein